MMIERCATKEKEMSDWSYYRIITMDVHNPILLNYYTATR
jgi:hypothetical protein